MRRFRSLVPLAALACAATLAAKDVYLPIVGSVGAFRTDARIVNPSATKDINIIATFISTTPGVPATTVPIQVLKRQQRVFDDVVANLFSQSGLGAIKLTSSDDFIATARIYATVTGGTAGQFEQGVDATAASTKGIIPQLESTGVSGQSGTFRTNIGFVNPGAAAAAVTLRLRDRNNSVVSTQSISIPAGAVLSPANYFATATGDFADSWASYESDVPLIAYGSVIDNGTTDPTFIQAVADSGSEPSNPGVTRTFDVIARQWRFDISPGGAITANVGDTVVLRLRSGDVSHGFLMPGFVDDTTLGGSIVTKTFVVTAAGNFDYFCTVSTCGVGHGTMSGEMVVNPR